MISKIVHSARVATGSGNYFFDIKQLEAGGLYLKISESEQNDSSYAHQQFVVKADDLEIFTAELNQTLTRLKELKDSGSGFFTTTEQKAYSVEQIRKSHQQAYMPWTTEDDEKLKQLSREGKSVGELAKIFGRKEGAITSRIRKLEL